MLVTKNLSVGYSKKPIIENINLSFEKGIYGILGTSGKGKTTFLKTLAGLIRPLKGEVLLEGEKILKANKNGIYMMHQGYTCFDWLSVIDNVLLAKKLQRRINTEDIQDAAMLLEKVGLETHLQKYPKQLSGGQRQRLALARTLFAEPQVILMDEPLSALDQLTRHQMQGLLIDYQKKLNNTVIMVTHSEEEAKKMCRNIIYF